MFKKTKLLLGVLVGTAFGMAFAPKKGKELREEVMTDLKRKGNAKEILKKTAQNIGKDLKQTAKEIYEIPEVQMQIKKGKTEAAKIYKEVEKELIEKGHEFTKIAKAKFIELKNKMAEDFHLPSEAQRSELKPKEGSKEKTKHTSAKKASAKKTTSTKSFHNGGKEKAKTRSSQLAKNPSEGKAVRSSARSHQMTKRNKKIPKGK